MHCLKTAWRKPLRATKKISRKQMTYLESFSHSFQKIWNQRIVPKVCEPHSGAINIHRAREEETGT